MMDNEIVMAIDRLTAAVNQRTRVAIVEAELVGMMISLSAHGFKDLSVSERHFMEYMVTLEKIKRELK